MLERCCCVGIPDDSHVKHTWAKIQTKHSLNRISKACKPRYCYYRQPTNHSRRHTTHAPACVFPPAGGPAIVGRRGTTLTVTKTQNFDGSTSPPPRPHPSASTPPKVASIRGGCWFRVLAPGFFGRTRAKCPTSRTSHNHPFQPLNFAKRRPCDAFWACPERAEAESLLWHQTDPGAHATLSARRPSSRTAHTPTRQPRACEDGRTGGIWEHLGSSRKARSPVSRSRL